MAGKIVFLLCLMLSTAFTQFVPWRAKVLASPPRPTSINRPTENGGENRCGGRYRNLKPGQYGVITSPGYPNTYSAGLECEWIVEGMPGTSILATFFDIRTQNAVFSEVSDSLFFSLSGNWSDSQRLSGDLNSVTPLIVISDGNRLLLRFKSSSLSAGNRGFRTAFYITSTDKPAVSEIGHDTYTVIACNYIPVDHPTIWPEEGGSKVKRVNLNPFLVGLILDDRQFCSGTLLSDKHVLSSAHCTHGAKRIDLVFGTSDLLLEDAGVQKRFVNSSSVKEHPFFDTYTGGNDVSIIKLNEPVTLNEFVTPVALPTWTYIGTTLTGLKTDITGWGDANNGNIFSQANSRVSRITSNAVCRANNKENTGNSLCTQASQVNETSKCQTDSGSPIVVRGTICGGPINQGGEGNTNTVVKPQKPTKPKPNKPSRPHLKAAKEPQVARPLLLGVVSHGTCEKGFSATRITAYLDFLESAGVFD